MTTTLANQLPRINLANAGLAHYADYLEAVPPSTGKSIPVMKLLSSEARNTAADAISSAVPSRPIGIIFLEVIACPFVRCFSADMDHGRLRWSRTDYVRANATASQLCGPGPDKGDQ